MITNYFLKVLSIFVIDYFNLNHLYKESCIQIYHCSTNVYKILGIGNSSILSKALNAMGQ
jgi:hypothetical protein